MILFAKALLAGAWTALHRIKLVFWLFLIQVAFATFAVGPFVHLFDATFAHSQTGHELASGYDPEAVEDFLTAHRQPLAIAWGHLHSTGLVWLLSGILWLGGILSIVSRTGTRTSLLAFAAGSARHAWTFARATLFLAVLLAALWEANYWASRAVRWYFVTKDEYGASAETLGWVLAAKTGFMSLLLAWIFQGIAYAKIAAVVDDRRGMIRGTLRGLALVVKKPIATNLVWFTSLASFASLLWVHLRARAALPIESVTILERVTLPPEATYLALVLLTGFLTQALLVAKHAGMVTIYKNALPSHARTLEDDIEIAARETP